MKRAISIKAATNAGSYPESLQPLVDAGIDVTRMKYELKAEKYERYGQGNAVYTTQFDCPGDYLAYLSMMTHCSPSIVDVNDAFGSVEELVDFISDVNEMESYASGNWYGDGDDYIYYLKNLTTGQDLYIGDYDPEQDNIKDNNYNW